MTAKTPPPVGPFYDALHSNYIVTLGDKLDSQTSYEGAVTEHLRVSGVYWSLAALSLLRNEKEVDELMGLTKPINREKTRSSIVDWVFQCYNPRVGGFGGNCSGENPHDAHLLYTLSALQVLAMANSLDDERLHKDAVVNYVSSLQNEDGSFSGDEWGEIDTRFTYCAFSCLALLGRLPLVPEGDNVKVEEKPIIDMTKAVEYIISCRNFDGGFGAVPGAESHAGQVFCCVGALSIAKSLHLLKDADLLSWWLAERQCDSGGLNGRPEKQADVCYSWWILSALSIMGRVDWINTSKLCQFILNCQDDEDGGIADRPMDMPDVYHTFFGLCGLSLIGHLEKIGDKEGRSYRQIDPVFALPTDVVSRLSLKAQVIRNSEVDVDKTLQLHSILHLSS
jgi:geranylgeranyl transferase type-2 subunit beta